MSAPLIIGLIIAGLVVAVLASRGPWPTTPSGNPRSLDSHAHTPDHHRAPTLPPRALRENASCTRVHVRITAKQTAPESAARVLTSTIAPGCSQ